MSDIIKVVFVVDVECDTFTWLEEGQREDHYQCIFAEAIECTSVQAEAIVRAFYAALGNHLLGFHDLPESLMREIGIIPSILGYLPPGGPTGEMAWKKRGEAFDSTVWYEGFKVALGIIRRKST